MSDSIKVVSVFLASPGDLEEEREALNVSVDRINNFFVRGFGYEVRLVRWENTVGGYGRPQEIINERLQSCEYFVGLVWKRWGSPPDRHGKFASGFEEEVSVALGMREKSGRPEMQIFFKKLDSESDPGPQLTKVIEFRKKLQSENALFYKVFKNTIELQALFEQAVGAYVTGLIKADLGDVGEESAASLVSGAFIEDATDRAADKGPLDEEGLDFLRSFTLAARSHQSYMSASASDVARLRLLGNIVSKAGNNISYLGVHDANIIFSARSELNLGSPEMSGLVACGLRYFANQSAPLWHWIGVLQKDWPTLLPFCSYIGQTNEERAGALEAMRLIGERLPAEGSFNREFYIGNWFASHTPGPVRIAALRYLATNGESADITSVKSELERDNYQTRFPALECLLQMMHRYDRKGVAAVALKNQFETIKASILRDVLPEFDALNDEELLSGLQHRNASIRARCLNILSLRGGIKDDILQTLFDDDDATVRYAALNAFLESGNVLAEVEVRKVLVHPKTKSTFALFSLTEPDLEGERWFDDYQWRQLFQLSLSDLRLKAASDAADSALASLVLADRFFSNFCGALRESLDKQFSEFEADRLNSGDGASKKKPDESQRSRCRLARRGLDILARRFDPKDLERIRSNLQNKFVGHSACDVEYLRRLGDWSDILVLAQSAEPATEGRSLLYIPVYDERYVAIVANALIHLAGDRLADLLNLGLSAEMRTAIVARSGSLEFSRVPNTVTIKLLADDSDKLRKITALKCVVALASENLEMLLGTYRSRNETVYYNVVHWLDLGLSMPPSSAPAIAGRAIEMTMDGTAYKGLLGL